MKMIMEMGDQEIVQWLQNEGLLKRNLQCIACGSFLTLTAMNDRDKMGWRCLNYGCDKKNHTVSVRIQSFFSGSKLTLKDQVLLVLFWSETISNQKASRLLKISRKTVTKLFQKFRNLTSQHFQMHPIQLGGPGIIVQIDESVFSTKAKYHRGAALHQKSLWVFGAVDEDGMGYMEIVEDRTRVTLEAVVINRIRAGSVIHSDCWASYNHISTIANKNFTHGTVNHSNKDFPFKDPITGVHTNRIEGYWSKHKRPLKAMCGVPRNLLQSYIDEFLFKERIPSGVNKFQAVCDLIKDTHV